MSIIEQSMKKGKKRPTTAIANADIIDLPDRKSGEYFRELQSGLLSKQAKVASRAPGRARVETIIDTTIELLAEHARKDITIAMIATTAGMRRTSVYAHFNSMDDIFEQIAVRFIEQTGLYVDQYVRDRNPSTLLEVVIFTIDGIQEYFNRPDPDVPGALAAHVPFDARQVIEDFDRVSALTYHSLWKVDWPIEPLSEQDPFRVLITLQSSLFDLSIRRHGIITDEFAEEAKQVAIDFIKRVEKRFAPRELGDGSDRIERIGKAITQLTISSESRFLDFAVNQMEGLAALAAGRKK
jgi:AcrR family transcriptional regulator